MRIKKVKYDKKEKRVLISYEEKGADGYDNYTLDSEDAPNPSLLKSLSDLASDVLYLCEIQGKQDFQVEVRSISFSYGGDKEVMGATISAGIALERSYCPLNVNTPHKASESYSEHEDPKQLLDESTIIKLKLVQEEAIKFINGDRAQLKMDMPDNNTESAVESEELEFVK